MFPSRDVESIARSVASIAILAPTLLKVTARTYRPRNCEGAVFAPDALLLCDCDFSPRFGIIARSRSSSGDSSERFSTAGGDGVSAVFVLPAPAAVERCLGPSEFFGLRDVSDCSGLLFFELPFGGGVAVRGKTSSTACSIFSLLAVSSKASRRRRCL